MALLFGDSMDGWTALSNSFWSAGGFANGGSKATNSGRFGGGGISFISNTGNNYPSASYMRKTMVSTYSTLILSTALNISSNTGAADFLAFFRGTTSQLCFRKDATNKIYAIASGDMMTGSGSVQAGTTLGTSSLSLSPSAWHWISVKVTFHSTAGTVDFVVDGTSFLSLTGLNTSPVAGNLADGFVIGSGGNNAGAVTAVFDDVVFCDTSGSSPLNGLLGDRRFYTQSMVGAGVNGQFTPLSGTRVSNIQESPAMDSDTTYNSDSTSGDIDDFTHGTLPAVASIDAVILKTWARKDDAGSRSIQPLILSGGTEGDGGSYPLTTSYQGFMDVFTADPHTSAAWTKTNWDAATVGYKNV